MKAFLTVTTPTSFTKGSCITGTVITATITAQYLFEPVVNSREEE
jgi:hypothetical protein